MIDLDILINPLLTEDSQHHHSQVVNPEIVTPTEVVQDLLRPFVEDLGRVREQLGAERVLREQAERERDRLSAELEALREARDVPEKASEGPDRSEVSPEHQEDVQRRSWLYRFFFGPE